MEITDAQQAPPQSTAPAALSRPRQQAPGRQAPAQRRTSDLVASVVLLLLGPVLFVVSYLVFLVTALLGTVCLTQAVADADAAARACDTVPLGTGTLDVLAWSPVTWPPLAVVVVVLLVLRRRAWPVALVSALLFPLGNAVITLVAAVPLVRTLISMLTTAVSLLGS